MDDPLEPGGDADPLAHGDGASGIGFSSDATGIRIAAVVLALVGVANVLIGIVRGTVLGLLSIPLGILISYVALGYWRRRWWAYWCGGGVYLLMWILGATLDDVALFVLGAPGALYTIYRRDAFQELA